VDLPLAPAPEKAAVERHFETVDGQRPEPAFPRLALRRREVAEALGISNATLDIWWRAGNFPAPRKTVTGYTYWTPETVQVWLAAQPTETRRAG